MIEIACWFDGDWTLLNASVLNESFGARNDLLLETLVVRKFKDGLYMSK